MSKEKDFSYNRNRYGVFNGRSYQIIDRGSRLTSQSDKSPRVNGKLRLKENIITRSWEKDFGIPPVAIFTSTSGTSTISTTLSEGTPPDHNVSSMTTQATNTALARFHKRLEDRIILGMEYIVERKSIWNYIQSGARLLYDIYIACRKRSFRTLRKYDPRRKKVTVQRVEMSFHEKWLEYHFAIAPMMQDIYNVLDRQRPQPRSKIRVRATVNQEGSQQGQDFAGAWIASRTTSVRIALVGSAYVEDPILAAGNYVGLDPSKFLWDIIPFSFVVEWFFNVGQWLDTISTPGWAVVDTSVTTLLKEKTQTNGWCTMTTSSGSYSTLGSGVIRERVSYTRRPGPLPDVKVTWQGGVDSTWRAITSLALLRSIFGSK